MDPDASILYRISFGLADQFREARDFNMDAGRWRSNAAAGGDSDAILAEVLKRLEVADLADVETVREAVGDALARRRPRW